MKKNTTVTKLIYVVLYGLSLFLSTQSYAQTGTCGEPIMLSPSSIGNIESIGSFNLERNDLVIDCEGRTVYPYSLVFKIGSNTGIDYFETNNTNIRFKILGCCSLDVGCNGGFTNVSSGVASIESNVHCVNSSEGYLIAYSEQDEVFDLWASREELFVTCGDPLNCSTGLDCSVARPLECGDVHPFGTFQENSNIIRYCNSDDLDRYTGPEVVYRIYPSESKNYRFNLTNITDGQDLDMYLLDGCNPDNCIDGSNNLDSSDENFDADLEAFKEYYLVIDGWDGSESDYTISMTCDTECEDLSDDYACFPFYPLPNGNWQFSLASAGFSEFDNANSPTDIKWTIDDALVSTNVNPAINLQGGRTYDICVEWTATIGEITRCYKFCKTIFIPIDPQDCDEVWVHVNESGYVFSSQLDVLQWNLHDQNGNNIEYSFSGDGQGDFNSRRFIPDYDIAVGDELAITILYRDNNGRIRVCCKDLCPVDYDQVGRDRIYPKFTSTRIEVIGGLHKYELEADLPISATIVKWKVFPSSDDTSPLEYSTNEPEVSLDINRSSTWTICLIYEVNGCWVVCCRKVCLADPYNCNDNNTNAVAICDNGSYSISSNQSNDVLYWTDANGNIIPNSEGAQNLQLDQTLYSGYVYCYYETGSSCEGGATQLKYGEAKNHSTCCIEVCCIPLPDDCCTRIDLGTCYTYIPTTNNTAIDRRYNFTFPENTNNDPRLNSPRDIQWVVDGQESSVSNSPTRELVIPSNAANGIEVCVRWESNGQCYEFCKTICFVNPYDCDRFWWYPVGISQDQYMFKGEDDIEIVNWEVHTASTSISTSTDANPTFSTSDFSGSSDVYMTLTYKENGCLKICCRRICLKPQSESDAKIELVYTGTENQVNANQYRYSGQAIGIPSSASILKWKYYNTATPENISEKNNPSATQTFTLIGSAQSTFRICVIYEWNGCIYVCCVDVCLTNPYNCFDDNNETNTISCMGSSYTIQSDNQVAYWSTSTGEIIADDGSNRVTVPEPAPESGRYIYCYYWDCGTAPQLKDVDEKSIVGCRLKVCCIPLPDDCEEESCYDDCCDGVDRSWLTPIIDDLRSACDPSQGGGDISDDSVDGWVAQGTIDGQCHYAVWRPTGIAAPITRTIDVYTCDGVKVDELQGINITEFDHFDVYWDCNGFREACDDCRDVLCDDFLSYNPNQGISSVNSEWTQTGVNDLVTILAPPNLIGLEMVPNAGSRWDFANLGINEITIDFFHTENTLFEGAIFRIYDNQNNFVEIELPNWSSTQQQGISYKPNGIDLGDPIYSPVFNETIPLKFSWKENRFEFSYNDQGIVDDRNIPILSSITALEITSKDFDIGNNFITKICLGYCEDSCYTNCCEQKDLTWLNLIKRNLEEQCNYFGIYGCNAVIEQCMFRGECVYKVLPPDCISDAPTIVYNCSGDVLFNYGALGSSDIDNQMGEELQNCIRTWDCTNGDRTDCESQCDDLREISCERFDYTSSTGISSQSDNWFFGPDSDVVNWRDCQVDNGTLKVQRVGNINCNSYLRLPTSMANAIDVEFDILMPYYNFGQSPLESDGGLIELYKNPDASGESVYIKFIRHSLDSSNDDRAIQILIDGNTNDNGSGDGAPFAFNRNGTNKVRVSLDKSSGACSIYVNDGLVYSIAESNLNDIRSLALSSLFNTNQGSHFFIDNICISECGSDDCEEILPCVDEEVFIYTAIEGSETNYLFTLLDNECYAGGSNFRWCINGVDQEISLGETNNSILSIPQPGRYEICIKFDIPDGEGGTRCVKICKEICIDSPFLDYDEGCIPISVGYAEDGQYYLHVDETSEMVEIISWRMDSPVQAYLGNANPQLFNVNDYAIASEDDVIISVRYKDKDGCIRTCCKRLCDIITTGPVSPSGGIDCEDVEYFYTGEGFIYEFCTGASNPGGIQIICRGEAQRPVDPGIEVVTITDGSDLDLSTNPGCIAVDLAAYAGKGKVSICFQYVDEEGCLRICCKEICVGDVFSPEVCDLVEVDYNGSDINPFAYNFNLVASGAQEIQWTVHKEDEPNPEIQDETSPNFEIDFIAQGYSPGDKVCVTVRYYDPVDKCFKTCCKCFCLVDPFAQNECGVLKGRLNGSIALPLAYQFNVSSGTLVSSWTIHGEGASTTLDTRQNQVDIDFQSYGYAPGDRVCVTVVYYDIDSNCFRTCCYCICLTDSYNDLCELITPHYTGSINAPLRYDLQADLPASATDIEWTVHDDNGSRFVASGEVVTNIDFGQLGYQSGDQVCVTIRYYDATDKCYKVCCICFCLNNPYDLNNCAEINLEYTGTLETALAYTLSVGANTTSTEWTIHDENGSPIQGGVEFNEMPNGDLQLSFDPESYPSGTIICATVRYYDVDSGCWKTCCLCFCIRNPLDCGLIEHQIDDNILNLTYSNNSITEPMWYALLENRVMLSTESSPIISVSDPIWGGREKVVLCLKYYDSERKCWTICCKEICLLPGGVDCSAFTLTDESDNISITDNNSVSVVSTSLTLPNGIVETLSNAAVSVPITQFGEYEICRTYNDACEGTIQCCKMICVSPDINCNPISVTSSPNDDLTFLFNQEMVGSVYAWDFGDGTSSMSSDSEISHTYETIGAYQACLTVTNECGQTCEQCIVVNAGNAATLDIGDVCGAIGETVRIPIQVNNFNDYNGGSFSIQVVDAFVEFNRIVGNTSASDVYQYSITNSGRDINIIWLPSSPTSLANGDTLAFLDATIKSGSNSTTSLIFLDNAEFPARLLLENGSDVTFQKLGGSICVSNELIISGKIKTVSDLAIPTTSVFLMENMNQIGMDDSNSEGTYMLSARPGDYIVIPEKDIAPGDRASIGDFRLILDHALQKRTINDPYSIIAADINRDDRISIADFRLLLDLYLKPNLDIEFDPWRFIPKDYVFADPTNPFEEEFPEEITLNDLSSDINDADFIGIHVSDVNGSIQDINLKGANEKMMCKSIIVDDVILESDLTYDVLLQANDFTDIEGFSLELLLDTSKLTFAEYLGSDLQSGIEFGSNELLEEGIIKYIWIPSSGESLEDGQRIISFKVLSKTNEGNLMDYLTLSTSNGTNTYLESNFDEKCLELRFNEASSTSVSTPFGEPNIIEIFQPAPNPFITSTMIEMSIRRSGNYTFSFYAPDGKLLHQSSEYLSVGSKQYALTEENVNHYSGVIIGKVESSYGGQIFRLIRLN